MRYVPHGYQTRATKMITGNKSTGLFLDMGLGKTVITLTAVKELIEDFAVSRVLVIAPKRVAEDTWSREHEKWDHLRALRISKVLGSRGQREKALGAEADIYIIGRDNTKWLVQYLGKKWDFDMVVIDELSSFKNPASQRFRALRRVIPLADKVVGLTGTPSPNGLIDLWAQVYLLDQGERLGRTVGMYREKYFYAGASNGHVVYRWEPRKGAQAEIEGLISDICMSMSADDYLDMPDRLDNEIMVGLSGPEMKKYRQMEEEQLLTIEDESVVALSAAAVMNKLLQMANGSVYTDEGKTVRIHERKLEALEEIADTAESPLLVFYAYRHDLSSLKERFPDARELEGQKDISDWNSGRIKMLVVHPASVGYGLNLQEGGHVVVWYGLTWSLELYQQANARLYRQGQEKTVVIHHLIAAGTVDEQVMKALKKKDTGQSALLAALKERRL